ncbi:MAG: ABC transporter ATP-binding protein, partial [Clostridia bacterium]|nr:ABC transporter ATP-binding protein [Clostridia bacterium]
AMTMGTRIVVLKDGIIQQVDAPQKLYDYPANLFVAGFIGTPQMNFFDAVLTGTKDKVYVEFEGHKLLYPKSKSATIINLEEYLNTGKPVVIGIRPEDFHDNEAFITKAKESTIEINVEVVERLGAETLLYCVFGEQENVEEGVIKSLVETNTQMVAKVDARSKISANQKAVLGVDILHSHLFDKETELSILEGEGTKAYVPVVELERLAKLEAENAEKARIKAEKEAAKAAKKTAKKGE